jgi:hypothetical protein
MRDRHWEQLSEGLPFDFKPDASLTLKDVVGKYRLQDYTELIGKIGEKAGKEYQIESSLDKVGSLPLHYSYSTLTLPALLTTLSPLT